MANETFKPTSKASWTTPYHGVSHMDISHASRYQFTVEDYGSFAVAKVFPLDRRPFTNCTEKTFNDTTQARAWLVTQAQALDLIAE